MRNTRLPFRRSALACFLSVLAVAATPDAWSQFKPGAGPLAPGAGPLVPGTGALASVPAAPARIRTVDSIVAVVNKDVITQKELDERTEAIVSRIASQGQNGNLPPRAEIQRQVLERMIVETAQLQLAKEMNIQVDDMMLDRAVARIAEQNRMSLQEFRNQLETQGMPFAKFREEIRNEIIMQRLREREVDNKIQISESEIENYLAEEAGAGHSQQEWNVAQILVRIPENASPEQIEQRRQRAEQLLQQLKSGADFAKLAAASSDADEALKGGELGWRTQDRLPQLFVDALGNLQPGEVAPLVKSANGFHILKLVGKRTPSVVRAGNNAAAPATITQTHARHILIKVNQIVSSLDAQRKLQDLKQRLDNKAATFEELARSYSNDLTASKGGDLGWIYPGDTVPEFERAMNALEPGQISEPIESPFGFHLIQVLERKNEDVSQERKRLVARQALRERKLEEATQEWLRQLRDRAYVEYRNEER
ncbi:periplasmic chaperone for outer membrane proteins SurA [Paucimonas lemoignei]|uniref:Chaperone SurA n=1 Tax=Paucimonas lemoignei TaxID=29443 RepID=A0A4R3I026_PAULE|nr:peptidylprolyl isomerase [Paucimonas lemoignei]TCS38313.1 periplasmic chaperone for outer membrane proteins SurA [Paucimonas lemoignei]